jgi:hypothetical protein
MKNQDGIQLIIMAIDRQTAVLEGLPALIGRELAKWLVRVNLPGKHSELREAVLAELGLPPIEIVDLLYPNLGKTDRRAKAKTVSERLKK